MNKSKVAANNAAMAALSINKRLGLVGLQLGFKMSMGHFMPSYRHFGILGSLFQSHLPPF